MRRSQYLVGAMGALVALGGVYLFAMGYPIIEVERGWAQVIAGATLFGAGVVTLAVGALIGVVSRLSRDLEAGAFEPEPETEREIEASVPRAVDHELELEAEPELEPEPEPEPAHVPGPHLAAVAPPLEAAPLPAPKPVIEAPIAPSPPPAPVEPAKEEEAIVAVAPLPEPPPDDIGPAPIPEVAPEPVAKPVHVEAPPAVDPSPEEATAVDEVAPTETRAGVWIAEALAERPTRPTPPAKEAAASDTRFAASAPRERVVSRYQISGVEYTLYGNGVIEGIGPDGPMRFTSIEQLRAHLEKGTRDTD